MDADRPIPSEIEFGVPDDDGLPDDLRALVKSELRPGERLLWAARAVRPPSDTPGFQGNGTGLAWFVGSAGVALGSLAYILGAFGPPSEVAVILIKLLAFMSGVVASGIAIGLATMLAGRASARRRAALVAYALTDARAILWRPRHGTQAVEIYTFPARSLASIHRAEFPDGSGDVIFGDDSPDWITQGFLGVAEVRRVEALAREHLLDPSPARRPRRREEYH